MLSSTEAEEIQQRPKGSGLPCETPGCSVGCSHAYSCHEQRMGRTRLLAWPLVALALFLVIGFLA